ncbi:MAG TPA: biotin/lipoyl-containing protein [Pyrinomonadaceae bacterium]|jgi:biotin carboxyl carrier protein|nr:biotin/lipoyl-containing protein [Pyrinomonadaceae bacterium]
MKLTAEINNETREVTVRREGNKVFATVGDKTYELEAHQTAPNTYLFKHEGKVYECYVAPETAAGKTQVTVGAQLYEFKLADPKRLSHTGSAHAHGDGTAEIISQMPGKVVRILVSVGDEVKTKDGVIVVEAMKMQNEMKSPKDGTVKAINFAEGETVNAGDVLVVIE